MNKMKNERVFITGCGGMLGNAVYPFFKSWYDDVLATDKIVNEDWLSELDIRDSDRLKIMIDEYKPDIILHLAAETDLEYCEKHPEITKETNDIATKHIARLAEANNSTLIYISTAGVFDGQKQGYYKEDDQAQPLMVYGKTKYKGELHTLEYCSKSYVVRAGWMMGGGRKKEKKFIYKILQQIGEGRTEIFAVDDKWGTPTYTYDFAMNLFLLLATKQYGRYHMVCEGKGTRYDVAKEMLRICNRPDIKLTRVGSDFFADEYFAPRPFSEKMANTRLSKLGINQMRPWKTALKDYIHNHYSDYINGVKPLNDDNAYRNEARNSDDVYPSGKRALYRKNHPSEIGYTILNGFNPASGELSRKGLTANVNNDGMCIYAFESLKEGACVTLTHGPDVIKHKTASVRWVKHHLDGVYKVGLMFHDQKKCL